MFTTEGHILVLNSTHLVPPPAIRRTLRRDEQPVCPAYVAPRIAVDLPWKDRHGQPAPALGGLIGTVRSRGDFEYARLLSGVHTEAPTTTSIGTNPEDLPLVPDEDQVWWDESGWCEVPKVEEYVSPSASQYLALAERPSHVDFRMGSFSGWASSVGRSYAGLG